MRAAREGDEEKRRRKEGGEGARKAREGGRRGAAVAKMVDTPAVGPFSIRFDSIR